MLSKLYRFPLCSLIIFSLLNLPVSARPSIQKNRPAASRRISFADAQRMIAGETEGNLSKQQNKFSRTRLSSGQVLEIYYPIATPGRTRRSRPITAPGYGVLYESEEAFQDAVRPRHMLEELIPDGGNLVENIPALVSRLEKRLRLGPGKLDYSRSSLRRVDSYIAAYQSGRTTAQTDPKLFQELTAYYGETLRRALNGRWKIHEERIGGSFVQVEPNLSFEPARVTFKPWGSVISALYDEDKRGIGLTKVFDADFKAISESR